MDRAREGDWVEVEVKLLDPADRSTNLPPETAEKPLMMWVKGFAEGEAAAAEYSPGAATRLGLPGIPEAAETVALARDLAEKSREALHLGKRLFWDTAGMTYAQALSFGRSLRVNYMLSEDLREGTTAFLEKRKPNW